MHRANVASTLAIVLVVLSAACSKRNETTTTTSAPASASGANAVTIPSAMPQQPTEEANATEEQDEKEAADELKSHYRHHFGGVAMFVKIATDSLGVPADEQAKLDKIRDDLDTAIKPARDASTAVMTLLADGVQAGKVDTAKVDAAVAKRDAAAKNVHAAATDALDRLHATLTPEQRTALVEKVKANEEVWKETNSERIGEKGKETRLGRLAEELDLSPDQVDKISAALEKNPPPKADEKTIDAYVDAFDQAFPTDTFDAKSFMQANAANMAMARQGTQRMVYFYETVTPLLTADQRAKLATKLRDRIQEQPPAQGK